MIGFSVKRAWRVRWGGGVCTLPPCSRHLYSATWVHSDTTWLWKLHKMEMPTCNKDWPGSSGLANHLNALVYKCYLISTMHSAVTQSLCLHKVGVKQPGAGAVVAAVAAGWKCFVIILQENWQHCLPAWTQCLHHTAHSRHAEILFETQLSGKPHTYSE